MLVVITAANQNKKRNPLLAITALILLTLILILPTDSKNLNVASFSIPKTILENGDIIFRRGTSFVSNMVLMADKSSPYSHVGMIKIIDEKYFVIHSVPAEEIDEKDLTKIDPLANFLKRDRSTAITIYRLKIKNDILANLAANCACNYALQKTPFDSDFNLKDGSRLYCTELVWRSYLQAGIDLIDHNFEEINIPLSKGPYILPSSLLKSKHLKSIYSIKFL